jgi:hypothetical protein
MFLQDRGGSEAYQLFYFDVHTHEITARSDGVSRHGALVWSNCGTRYAFFRIEGSDWRVYVCTFDSHTGDSSSAVRASNSMRLVVREPGSWYPVEFFGEHLLVKYSISSAESYLYLVDISSGERSPISAECTPASESTTAEEGVTHEDEPQLVSSHTQQHAQHLTQERTHRVSYGQAALTATHVLFVSDQGSDFERLYARRRDAPPASPSVVLSAGLDWDVR